MRVFPVIGLLLLSSIAYADDSAPPAYRMDPSKPVPLSEVAPLQQDVTPTSSRTQEAWKTYDSPLRDCIAGDTIIPSSGHDLFGFLFHNQAQVNITMSIVGWDHKQCHVKFAEATNVMHCQFNRAELATVLTGILNATQFDPSGDLAQTLSTNCSASPLF